MIGVEDESHVLWMSGPGALWAANGGPGNDGSGALEAGDVTHTDLRKRGRLKWSGLP